MAGRGAQRTAVDGQAARSTVAGRAASLGTWSVLALLLGGFALRPQHAAIGPLLPLIQSDLRISHSFAGLLATIPVACMGLFALPAPATARRLGTRIAVGACIATVGVVGALRAVAPSELLIVLLTVPLGIGMGLGGALLPIMVRERFSDRPATATGMYTNGFQLGGAVVSAAAVPIALLLGGWRMALVGLSVMIGVLAVLWFVLVPPLRRDPAAAPPPPPRWPVRRAVVWGVALLFGLRAIVFQGLMAWLPSIYVEIGWSESSAGLLVFAVLVIGIPVTTVGVWLADRVGSRRMYLGAASATLLAGLAGLLALPALGALWAVLLGAALGLLFPITLTLPLDIAERPEDVGPISSMMFGVGYLIAAVSPVGLGAIRDVTGSFHGSVAALAVISGAILVLTMLFTPGRLRSHEAVAA